MGERVDSLLKDMQADRATYHRSAKRCELAIDAAWIAYIALIAFGALLGPIGKLAGKPVDASWVTACILVSAGAAYFIRASHFRAKSDAAYGRRDYVDTLIAKLKYESGEHVSEADLAVISEQFRQAKRIYGERLQRINTRRDAMIVVKRPTNTG